MLFSGLDWRLDWRNDYYVDDLNRVLEISGAFDREQNCESAVKHWADTSVLAVVRREQPILDSPTSLFSTSNGAHTLDSSPTSAMSLTSTGSTHTAEVDSCTTSPTTKAQASISPTSLDSSNQTTLYCRACSKKFTGSLQDAKSNLRRHFRETPRHNSTFGLKCPMSECERKNRMRSDNLGMHLQNVHKMSSKSDRQCIIDQCKELLAERADSFRKPRRRSSKKE